MSLDPNTVYLIRFGSAGDCLAALVNRDGSTPFPIRTKSCNPTGDDTVLWVFISDGQGRYFVYNKAWPGKSNRLDLVLQDTTSLYIPWMGPSDDKYNNQHWFVTESGQISSFGLDRAILTVTEIQGQSSLGALLRNETDVSNDAGTWKVLAASELNSQPETKPSHSSPPEPTKPTSPMTDAQPAPSPEHTTLLTSRLPKSEQNILATDQGGTSTQTSPTGSSSDGLGSSISVSTARGGDQTSGAQPTSTLNGSSTTPTQLGQSSSSLSGGVIAGIAAGSVMALVILLIIGIFWKKKWLCWRGKNHESENERDDAGLQDETGVRELRPGRPESNQFYIGLISERSNGGSPRQMNTLTTVGE